MKYRRLKIILWMGAMLCPFLFQPLAGQCDENQLINPGFETVGPPCGPVPPGGLINGSFNMGCMTGWESAWGTPSVCSNNPEEGSYYACLGANNEGFFQNLLLSPDSTYCLSFYLRRLNNGTGSLDVYLANGLVNQPMSNSGNPPINVLPSWQLLGSFPSTGNQWEQIFIPSFMQLDPANTQLLFLVAPISGLDVGIDDIKLATPEDVDPNVILDITCIAQSGGTFTFQGTLDPLPPGYEQAQWQWSFGDGQSGTGQSVTHTYATYGVYEVCLNVFLECGCDFSGCITFTYDACICACEEDVDPPQFVNFDPGPILVFCTEDIPAPQAPEIIDCDQSAFLVVEESASGPQCNRTINYRWIASDLCGNTAEMTQTILYENNLPPTFILPPASLELECQEYMPEFLLWINDFGGATVLDECGEVNLSVEYDLTFSGSCGEVPVDFIATDECGNQASIQAIFTLTDADEPELLIIPENLVFPCTGVDIVEFDQWLGANGGAMALDACGSITWSNDFTGGLTEDTVSITFIAEDECANILSFSALIIQTESAETIFDTIYTCDLQAAGIDTVIEVNQSCSLYVITQRIFIPIDQVFDSTFVCDLLLAGIDTTFYINRFGCDSLVIISSRLAPSDTIKIETFTCDPLLTGMDTTYFINRYGCDSLRILTVSLASTDTIRMGSLTCDPAAASADTLILTGSDGCDSVVINNILYSGGQFVSEDEVVVCGPGVNFSDTIQVQGNPCDSILITHYVFVPLDSTIVNTQVCNPNDTGTVTIVLESINGCDSTILIHGMYIPPDSVTYIEYQCFGPDTMGEGLLFIDQFGCDSLFAMFYLINATPDTQFVQQTTCDSSMVGLATEINPGLYCDTVRVIETVWVPALISRDTQSVCAPTQIVADTLYFVSSQGCDSLFILMFQYDGPQMSILTTDETCQGFSDGSIIVDTINGGVPPYLFSFNGGSFNTTSTWDLLSPGDYGLIVQDAALCRDTLTAIRIDNGFDLMIDAGPDIEVALGDIVPMEIDSVSDWPSLLWKATDPVECPVCPLTYLGPVTQEQFVYILVTSAVGCSAIDSFNVFLRKDDTYFVPNIFSPNLDGINDYFFLSASVSPHVTYDMAIFDRWGNLVFEAEEIGINDPAVGWDGYYRGTLLNPGVFTFMIKVNLGENRSETIRGNITLMR